jgi:thiamine monophosphate kinase
MMDLSDGLSKDIATLCFDNRLGFIFDAGAEQCVRPETLEMAKELGADCADWFYHGGEEYGLLFACEPSFDPRGVIERIVNDSACARIDTAAKIRPDLTRLGRFTSKTKGVLTRREGGKTEELRMKSWDHFKPFQTAWGTP